MSSASSELSMKEEAAKLKTPARRLNFLLIL